jgi:polysaccharide biosynthesis protein PelA
MSRLIGQFPVTPPRAGGGRRASRLLSRRDFGGCIAAGIGACGVIARPSRAEEIKAQYDPFLVYYGRDSDPAIAKYGLAILEPDAVSPSWTDSNTIYLGYLSLAEVHAGRSYFKNVAAEGLLQIENPNWPGAHLVELRDPRWQRRVLEQIIPGILAKGFHGVFLDTLDSAEFLENRDPKRYKGTVEAAAHLVRSIKLSMPQVPIMINRGYAVLPSVAGSFDMLLGESVRTTFSAKKRYHFVSDSDFAWQRDRMQEARTRDPRVKLFSLDYWDPSDRSGISRIYEEERRHGFIPYVATPDLTRIVPTP